MTPCGRCAMLPNGILGRAVRLILVAIALAASAVLMLRSSGPKSATVQVAEGRRDSMELERRAAAARAAVVVARAAEANALTKPALARADFLRSRVTVVRAGQLRVENTGAAEVTVVPVPPLVTERIEADSAAISALSLAL